MTRSAVVGCPEPVRGAPCDHCEVRLGVEILAENQRQLTPGPPPLAEGSSDRLLHQFERDRMGRAHRPLFQDDAIDEYGPPALSNTQVTEAVDLIVRPA